MVTEHRSPWNVASYCWGKGLLPVLCCVGVWQIVGCHQIAQVDHEICTTSPTLSVMLNTIASLQKRETWRYDSTRIEFGHIFQEIVVAQLVKKTREQPCRESYNVPGNSLSRTLDMTMEDSTSCRAPQSSQAFSPKCKSANMAILKEGFPLNPIPVVFSCSSFSSSLRLLSSTVTSFANAMSLVISSNQRIVALVMIWTITIFFILEARRNQKLHKI